MLPDYWLPQPEHRPGPATAAAVDEFLSLGPAGGIIDLDRLLEGREVVLWQFLRAVADRRELAFHGTGDPSIEEFVPRQPVDLTAFGSQNAVFATSDPVWAMYYAIVDRERVRSLNNACLELLDGDAVRGRYFYFSVSEDVLPERPWRTGHLYLLPAETFALQPAETYAGHAARVPQLASPVAVRPLARLRVEPSDFPYLDRIRGHDDDRLAEYAQAVMTASPWPD